MEDYNQIEMTEEEKKLLKKYWEGHCMQEEELREVNRLLHTKEGNQAFYELFVQQGVEEMQNPTPPDTTMQELVRSTKAEMQQRIAAHERSARPLLTRPILRWTSIAAAFVGVIILSGVFLWNNDNSIGLSGSRAQAIPYTELANPTGQPELHELPDGTQIWLAAGSTLAYPEPFDAMQRDVELSGEAFFNVARDEKRPFIVHSDGMETRVLGTSFKVTAFAGQEQEVSVATGKVSVSSNGQELALLTRGLQVRRNPETGETTQTEFDPDILEEWKAGALIFTKSPLKLVAEQLENRYGIEIDFADPNTASRRVRGKSHPRESIEDLLDALGYIGDFRYKKTNEKQYMIYELQKIKE